MAKFSRGVKRWWQRVVIHTDGYLRDQTMVYTEREGFHQSAARADEVHHIVPGTFAEVQLGQSANEQTGLPVARSRHNGRGTALPYCQTSTFHTDIGEARERYMRGDKKAFEKVQQKHVRQAERGKRYWGGDRGSDQYYDEMMTAKAVRYVAETGDKKPQSGKPKPRKKHWSDGLF